MLSVWTSCVEVYHRHVLLSGFYKVWVRLFGSVFVPSWLCTLPDAHPECAEPAALVVVPLIVELVMAAVLAQREFLSVAGLLLRLSMHATGAQRGHTETEFFG